MIRALHDEHRGVVDPGQRVGVDPSEPVHADRDRGPARTLVPFGRVQHRRMLHRAVHQRTGLAPGRDDAEYPRVHGLCAARCESDLIRAHVQGRGRGLAGGLQEHPRPPAQCVQSPGPCPALGQSRSIGVAGRRMGRLRGRAVEVRVGHASNVEDCGRRTQPLGLRGMDRAVGSCRQDLRLAARPAADAEPSAEKGMRQVVGKPCRERRGRARRAIGLSGIAALLPIVLAGCSLDDAFYLGWPRTRPTTQSEQMFDLWVGSTIAALAVGVIVWGLTFWCIAAYKKRDTDTELPRQPSTTSPRSSRSRRCRSCSSASCSTTRSSCRTTSPR